MDLHRYRLHLIGAALALISLLIILLYASAGAKRPSLSSELTADFSPLRIAPESIFLPAEPEIIPKVILSRPPRSFWSPTDAAPYWTDPSSIDPGPADAAARREADSVFSGVR